MVQRRIVGYLFTFWGITLGATSMGAQEQDPALSPQSGSIESSQPGTAEEFVRQRHGAGGSFGPQTQDFWLAANQFSPMNGTSVWAYQTFLHYAAPGGGSFTAQLELPAGAHITIMECWFNDTSAANDGEVILWKNTQVGTTRGNSGLATASSSGSGGIQQPFQSLDETVLFRNGSSRDIYWVQANMPADTGVSLRACRFFWNRQISPAPGSSTFADVGTSHTYFRAIEALAASGITGGCGSGNFCPNGNVTRGEMAAFLARALGLHFPF